MGFSSLNEKTKHGINSEGDDEVGVDSSISDSFSSGVSSTVGSLESDLMEDEATSSSSTGPLHDMSSLMQQLPLKRGLSNYFQGKSQSFTSLKNARCLEDLAKPEKPNNKKLKSCKSYGGLSSSTDHHHQSHTSSSSTSNHFPRTTTSSSSSPSRFISSKKALSRGSCSSLNAKRTASFIANRPPIPPPHPPHGSTSTGNFSNQTPLFA